MGWRSTGAAFRAGNYSGPLTSDEGGFAAGFAKTFTAGISKAADIIAQDKQAEREFEREKDLIRLRETLAAQRAAATASRTREKEDGEALAWALATVNSYGLANTPDNVSRLAGIYTSEGSGVQAGNAVDALIVSGALTLAPTDTATTAAPAPAELNTTVSSQNTTELPSVFNTSPTLDDLEATETSVPGPAPVETTQADPEVVPAPIAAQPTSLNFTNLNAGQGAIVQDLRKQNIDELRMTVATSDPNSFQGQAARQLYREIRTREIQGISDETTLLTITQNGSDWEREAALAVLNNIAVPAGSVRVKIGDEFILARRVRSQNGSVQLVDAATGQPIDQQQVTAEINPAEDADALETISSIISRANQPVEAAREGLVSYISAADSAYKMTQILAGNPDILTITGGVIPEVLSRIQSELNGFANLFGEEGRETGITADQVNSRIAALERQTLDLFANGQIDEAARDRAIYLAQERRLAYAIVRAQQGPGGVISNQDFENGLMTVRASVNAGTFEESLRKLILADETQVRIRMEQVAGNDFIRSAQAILDERGMDFPLVQDMFRTIPESFGRYGAGEAYQWLQGEIDLAQGQRVTLQDTATERRPLIEQAATMGQADAVDAVTIPENILDAMRRFVAERGGSELSMSSARDALLENIPGLTEEQLRQQYPEFFPDTSE
jgi:hypothetical protein